MILDSNPLLQSLPHITFNEASFASDQFPEFMIRNCSSLVSLATASFRFTGKYIRHLTIDNNEALIEVGSNVLEVGTSVSGNVYIHNNPRLTSLRGLEDFQQIGVLSIVHNEALETAGISFVHEEAAHAVEITNMPRLRSLDGLPLRAVTALTLTDNPLLFDYEPLTTISLPPTTLTLAGSCCPRHELFTTSVFTSGSFKGCVDCLTLQNLTPSRVLPFGGAFVDMSFVGAVESETVKIYFKNTSSSTLSSIIVSAKASRGLSGTLTFTTPSMPDEGNFTLCYRVLTHPITCTTQVLEFVRSDAYFGVNRELLVSAVDTPLLVSQASDSGEVPGLVQDKSSDAATAALIVFFAVLAALALFAFLTYLILRLAGCIRLPLTRTLERADIFQFDTVDLDFAAETRKGHLVRRRRTVIGGLSTLLGLFICIAFLAALYASIAVNNEQSNLTYRPNSGGYSASTSQPSSSSLSSHVSSFTSSYHANITILPSRASFPCSSESLTVSTWGLYGTANITFNPVTRSLVTGTRALTASGCEV